MADRPQKVYDPRTGKVAGVKYGQAKEEAPGAQEAREMDIFHQKAAGGKYSGLGGATQRRGLEYEGRKKDFFEAMRKLREEKKSGGLLSKLKVTPIAREIKEK